MRTDSFILRSQRATSSCQFFYTPDRSRWKQTASYAGTSEDTIYIGGLVEKVTLSGVTSWRHYIAGANGVVAVYIRRSTGAIETDYLLKDHLGSLDMITRSDGTQMARASSDAWGRRRSGSWTGNPAGSESTAFANTSRRAFTSHEALDNLNLIHMNGRVFDPVLARFLSADPIVQNPGSTQSFNRYSYTFNNPLTYTDPSGFQARERGHIYPINPNDRNPNDPLPPPRVDREPLRLGGNNWREMDLSDVLSWMRQQQTSPPRFATEASGARSAGYPRMNQGPSLGDPSTCPQRDPFLEAQVRSDPANGNIALYDGAYPTMTRSIDLALGVALSGTTQYVADFRSWTVHEISNVSIGYGPRAALWLGAGRGTFFASEADAGQWGLSPEVSANGAFGLVGIGFQADGWYPIPAAPLFSGAESASWTLARTSLSTSVAMCAVGRLVRFRSACVSGLRRSTTRHASVHAERA